MASFNSLPDLCTVDLKAIQDSEPVHPRISLPPLTTIAENWECADTNEKNLSQNCQNNSSTEEEDTSEDENERCKSSLRKVRESKSFYTSCSSVSLPNSGQVTSDSDLSDETSDSGSSSSDSDSDSATVSSDSSCGDESSQRREREKFAIKEANYDKGRVTLRLSTLQLAKEDRTILPAFTGITKPQHGRLIHETGTLAGKSINSLSPNKKLQPLGFSSSQQDVVVREGSVKQTSSTTHKRQLRRSPDLKLPIMDVAAMVVKKSTSKTSTRNSKSQGTKKIEVPSPTKMSVSADDAKLKDRSQRPQSNNTDLEPCLGDLDSDSDELTLPAVSEAIRMLDLDSQATSNCGQLTDHHTSASSLLGSVLPKLPLVAHSGFQNSGTWPAIGYCSSLLQQFVAKSQLGEPPPPPPPPTKGARKCFPPLDEVDCKHVNESRYTVQDTDVDLAVAMRGIDCHPSHVSPDSGIQSVSGSPFSAHSSPLHPSAATCPSQTSSVIVAAPRSPSPSRNSQKKGRKSDRASVAQATGSLITKRIDDRKVTKTARRPRSCRDTASALSSGMNKDSSIVQAIQRGMNAALRLTSNVVTSPNEFNQLPLTTELFSTDSLISKKTGKQKEETSNPEKTDRNSDEMKSTAKSYESFSTSRGEKRKKKKKKRHESVENLDCILADPSLVPIVDQLCSRLNRCTISRGSSSSQGVKRPFIFDRRKYAFGSMASLGGRSKRRRIDEEHSNQTTARLKKRGKPKKATTLMQTAPSKNPTDNNEPTVAAAAAAVVLTAVELLLPLKKRHHHLPAPETKQSDIEQLNCDSASEKPSHDSFAKNEGLQSMGIRKRNSDEPIEATDDIDLLRSASIQLKKGRGRKKVKLDFDNKQDETMSMDEENMKEAEKIQHDSENPPKKRNRRRKAINRTGFPSVKKKRKKPLTAEPQNVVKPVEECKHENSLPVEAKKQKIVSRNSSEEGSIPDPGGSEVQSSDERAVNGEINRPKKRRGLANLRKRYLPAGLLSNYFKEESDPSATATPSSSDRSKGLVYDPEEHEYGLLPPPFYCEKYLRRTKRDFQLPHDIWLLHQQGKLPDRDNVVPSWNYKKIRTNVYYDVKPPYSNDAQACNCRLPLSDAKEGESQCCGEDCLNRMVYTECSSQLCPVSDRCTNQQIQRHRWAQGLERFMTQDKGWGVRCRNALKAGQFILEYVGEVVSDKEFKERMHTIYVHDTHHYCLHLDGGLVIDGHRMGGDGRFVNHSCAPNCEMQKWSVNGLPRMALFAMQDIPAMQELSYDYNFSLFNPAEGQPCKCGSNQCRGVIGGKSQRVVPMIDSSGAKQSLKIVQQKRKRKTLQQGKMSLSTCLTPSTLRPLSVQQRTFVLDHRCFLLRNLDKVREWRDRQKDRIKLAQQQQHNVVNGRTRRLNTTRIIEKSEKPVDSELPVLSSSCALFSNEVPSPNEEIVRCRCKLFDDEGLMVQCEKCETWQHSDCLGAQNAKAALEAEHYVCSDCLSVEPVKEDLDIVLVPQPENPPDGLTFYLSLYYKDLHLRQGDCVYVLRDHDTPDSEKTLWIDVIESDDLPTPRPPSRLPSHIKISNLDIFQIERLWIDENGKKFVWGHHFFRPQDTYHEPSRKFYVNEVLYSPINEAIPIWAVAGRCWVLDPVTFCKGRPIDAVEEHVYICEYRVDRTARLFSKNARTKFPICTRHFAFRNFVARLKPQRTFQPHDLPASSRRKSLEPGPKGEKSKRGHLSKGKCLAANRQEVRKELAKSVNNKREEQRARIEKLLDQLLAKVSAIDVPVEDATHLLHRARNRGRGRPSKSKTDTLTP